MKILFSFILLFYLYLFLCFSFVDSSIIEQRQALLDLYDSTSGYTWRNNSNWGQGDVCSWFGISCTNGLVSFLLLPRNNLTGYIPDSISDIPTLRYMDLSSNHLISTIPESITELYDINIINLGGNIGLNGAIPNEIGKLSRLQLFDISVNNITGSIPDSICNCTSLRSLLIQYNHINGTLPENFYKLTSLIRAEMGYNVISGSISDNFGLLKSLETFQMPRNLLTGTIPESVGNITGLLELNLQYNQITGTIPNAICNNTYIERLILSGNFLEGNLPSCLYSKLLRVTQLDVSRNHLTGNIDNLDLVKLEVLDLSTNSFTGNLPSLSSLASIQFIDFSANTFTGTLPTTISNNRLNYMRSFDASSNQIGGTIPEWILKSTDVSIFLTNNEFICPYPESFPPNVHVDQQCVIGYWYQGLFVVVSIILEFIGFIITVIGFTITIAYLYRPSLLESFAPDNYEELNKDNLQHRSDCLLRSRNFLLGSCVLEIQASLLMFIVGIVMCFSSQSTELYSLWFLISVPITSILFLFKTILTIIFGIRRYQHGLLGVTISQLFQLIFVAWAFLLEGVAQANALSFCVIAMIIFDNVSNALSILEAYLIQDQFIPLHQLILDDTLKDAEGAFGEVRHGTYLGIDIAAKRAKPRTSVERKEIYKAFLKEAKILSELGHHSNIVKLIGVSPMVENEFYIVMEYCDNGTALNYLKKVYNEQGDIAYFKAIVKLCMGVCDAMHYFHSKGYTHRDITTSNIMVKRGRAMLGDMGLARRIKKRKSSPTSKYLPRYNLLYGAPELTKGEKYTPASDVFCFGVALWEMCMLRKWKASDISAGYGLCLQELEKKQTIFACIVSRCWYEEPNFRPTFAELLEEFSRLNHQDWSSYRII